GKIAVTTSSEEARKEFLAGRDLSEKLRITDSIAHFDKAISLDPNFALSELSRANSSPTAKEFFEKLVAAYPNDERAHFNLGGYYFGQQDFTQAISHYKRATELAPDYSTA